MVDNLSLVPLRRTGYVEVGESISLSGLQAELQELATNSLFPDTDGNGMKRVDIKIELYTDGVIQYSYVLEREKLCQT